MGALHAGHLELVRRASCECSFVAVSIFVNPKQFGLGEDLSKYPRPLSQDKRLLAGAGIDLLFCPRPQTVYPVEFSTYVEETALSLGLCADRRPGHFRGVCTVVAKLFNIVSPDIAYFGQKDYQQVKVIERMVRDLDFPITIKTVPTVRERSGLALSSRNVYLSEVERNQALILSRALAFAGDRIKRGERDADKIIKQMRSMILTISGARIDYAEIRDSRTLGPVKNIRSGVVVALAIFIGKTRLIDNMIFKPKDVK